MTSPQITVIIPTFRRPQLLKRAIKSVCNQTYSNLKIVICDNASKDETEEIVRELAQKDARILYYCHDSNIGMMGNYQFALSKIDTPLFSILSDDDVLFPWYLSTAIEGFISYPEIGFSITSTIIMSEKGEVIRVPIDLWNNEGYLPAQEGMCEMIGKYPPPTCVLFHQKVIKEFPIQMNNSLLWDCDFLLRIASRYPLFLSKIPCGILLHHSQSFFLTQTSHIFKNTYARRNTSFF
jgi:glycosyltransferase involved in cell wall biosynthesis